MATATLKAKPKPGIEEWLEDREEWRRHADLVLMPPTCQEALEEFPELEGSDLVRDCGDQVYTTYSVSRLALYMKLRRERQSHRFAEMVAMQAAPRCMTDDVFFAGLKCYHETMTDSNKQFILKQARMQGFEPPTDAIYQSGLARFPGDPEAFITRAMGRHYIRRLCEKRGWACEGAVNVSSRDDVEEDPLDAKKCVPLAESIIQERISDMAKKDPAIRHVNRAKLRQEIIRKHGPSD